MPRPKKNDSKENTVIPEIRPSEPTELELIEAEMRSISPRLPELRKNNQEEYEKIYKRYMWLVLRRDEILKGGA